MKKQTVNQKKRKELKQNKSFSHSNLDFNWNMYVPKYRNHSNDCVPMQPTPSQIKRIKLRSEDLRDGLHGMHASPPIEVMYNFIDDIYRLGVRHMAVGIYSGGSNFMSRKIQGLLRYLDQKYPDVTPSILSITSEQSIRWAKECMEINPKLETLIFMGSAPSRMFAEGWDETHVLESMQRGFSMGKELGLNIIGATEHTTQTSPDFLKKIINTQIASASRNLRTFCIADTIGIARPKAVYSLVSWTKQLLKELKREDVDIEWHGHEDMGNGMTNALVAIAAGAKYIDTVVYGFGERAGNTSMEEVLLNLSSILEEANYKSPWKMQYLHETLESYCRMIGVSIPQVGVLGENAFNTSLGIHTSAMLKLHNMAELEKDPKKQINFKHMSKHVYSAIHPESVGRKHKIKISPFSGRSTVDLYLKLHGVNVSNIPDETKQRILDLAKNKSRELLEEEIMGVIKHHSI